MIRISSVTMPVGYKDKDLVAEAAKRLRISKNSVSKVKIWKRSLDARKKPQLKYNLTIDVSLNTDEQAVLRKNRDKNISEAKIPEYQLPPERVFSKRPVVVGFGPAGMFAALILAECGVRPIVVERGSSVEKRARDVETFFAIAQLDEDSNIQFGEGGAGTFSDGKLNTGIKDPRIRKVLETFVENGAPEEILYESKPHIGTDKLPGAVKNIRNKIISLGGEVRFDTKAIEILTHKGSVKGVKCVSAEGESVIETDDLIFAVGHSARDTFRMIHSMGIPMEQKPFSVGVRIEHPAELINMAQHGVSDGSVGTADYKLSTHLPAGRGVYTFCMCPGGTVVGATSLKGHVVTNGMSNFARDGINSNSAVLVGIGPKDFGSQHPLAGIDYQEKIETAAFKMTGETYKAPAQRLEDFFLGRETKNFGDVIPSYRPGVEPSDIGKLLDEDICNSLREGIKSFGRKLKGFDLPDAVITAPETRSSSPVRILRNDRAVSIGLEGLYPCGEGAGYAGGITSAAVDGIRCAEAIMSKYQEK